MTLIKITKHFQPIIDFGLANVTLIKEVFGGYKVFNVFGMIVSYPIMAIIFLTITAIFSIVGMYCGQINRSVE